MQKFIQKEKEMKETTLNGSNIIPYIKCNSEIKTPHILNDINNFFPFIFSRKVIKDSLLCQQKTIYLQKELRGASKNIIEFIVNELNGNYREIILDKNGNYFISDLIKVCEQKHRIKI